MITDRGRHDPEWLEFHSPALSDDARRRRLRRVGVTAVVVAVVLVGWNAVRSPDRDVSTPVLRPTSTVAGSPTPVGTQTTPATAPPGTPSADEPLTGPTVLPGTGPLLSGAGDWDLFVRGNAAVFRIEVSTGRISRTETPPIRLTGEVSFVAGPHDVVIAPKDSGPGVLVPDEQRARPLPGLLATPGKIFPAERGRLWFQSSKRAGLGTDAGLPPVVLTDFEGKKAGPSIPISGGYLTSDGLGNLLLKDVRGVTEVDGTTVRPVTTGSVSAVGPHHLLLLDCDPSHACSTYLYNRETRQQRRIGSADSGGIASGVISPDGTHAALIHWDRAGPPHFVVLDLRDGTEKQIAGSPDSQLSEVPGNVVWSPDSRWLFSLVDGHLSILDVTTDVTIAPDLPLPPLRQITLRTPSAGND